MSITDVSLHKETQERYLTYALSVVSGRALPDVRDGLKPVQRRILYAMFNDLGLKPDGGHRKSAAVVGDVLAKYHPHGDTACYEAMVRMAQDFSLRYPLVDGQGNFGSLDGDSPAAYRYTEAKLREIAVDLVGEIYEETVQFRDNFDGTTQEPTVFPSRVPNLLINGASGIAVGMATSIPPHNLKDIIKALIELAGDPDITSGRLSTIVKAPDFPTGCLVLNTKKEIDEIYRSGKGSIRMRGEWNLEDLPRGKKAIIITSIPYAVNKSQLVERIANLIIERKVPQLQDVRDESTEVVRVVLELSSGASAEAAMAYIYKHTPLENNFAVNLTVLVPTPDQGLRPELLSLKACLQHFLEFRHEVTVKRLQYEKKKLLERIHILEGLVKVFDQLDKAIQIVRKSDGRSDAAEKLRKAFSLTEIQAFAIVDMRIYQLSKTNIDEIRDELKIKSKRVADIDKILKSKTEITKIVVADLQNISDKYGDKRKSELVKDSVEAEFNEEDYVVQEDVYAIVTRDGWVKRIRQNNDVTGTRVREGDSVLDAHALNTLDSVVFFTSLGNIYILKTKDFPASSGFGEPLSKVLKFKDGERVVKSFAAPASKDKVGLQEEDVVVMVTASGVGFALKVVELSGIKRNGRRAIKLRDGDTLAAVLKLPEKLGMATRKGFGLIIKNDEIPVRDSAAVGVQLIKIGSEDSLVSIFGKPEKGMVQVELASGKTKEISWSDITVGHRALKGNKIISQGEVLGVS